MPLQNNKPDPKQPRLRFYARTDDGDWTELSPMSDADAGSGVDVFATFAYDDNDLFLQAGDAEGELLGRLVVIYGQPSLLAD